MGTCIIYLSSCLSLLFLMILIKFFKKLWWTPIHIQSMMRSQGIKGPPYRFLHGSTKEIMNMRNEVMMSPMESSSHHVFPKAQPHIYSWMRLYGKNFVYWLGPHAHLVVTEPELVKEILNNKDGAYPRGELQGFWKKLLGDGLISSTGEKWVKRRKLANYAFRAESLKGMIPAMIESAEMMLERWRKQEIKEIEVLQEIKVLTSEIISRTAFGSNYLEGEQIFDMLTKMTLIVSRNNFKIRIPGIRKFLKTHDDIESEKLEEGIRKSIIRVIKKREKELVTGELDSYDDFLSLLMKAYHDTDKTKSISLDDLIGECKTFYLAGHETTTSSLTWTILLLAIHTEWQDKARIEVLELIGQENPTADSITKFKTINMIVNESLRLYPTVTYMTRKVSREVRLGSLTLPEDIELYISTLALQHDPEIWGEDVHLFKPERFAEGVAKATKNNAITYFPFGFGPRNCVGSNFALTETKIVLSMILQRYKFVLSPTYVHSPVVIITLYPQHGVKVMLQEL
ncbi:hypothetical protein REPUB_Repub01dG0030400 [Reevesia pubescens]